MLTTPSDVSGGILLNEPLNREHPLNQGRIGWWYVLPQWCGGNTWFDLCQQYNGTISGSASGFGLTQQGNVGGYGSLAQNGSSIYASTSAYAFGTTPLSVAAWVKVNSFQTNIFSASNGTVIFDTRTIAGDISPSLLISQGVSNTFSSNRAMFIADGNSLAAGAAGTTSLTTGIWYRILGTYDGAGNWNIYLNGNLEGTNNYSGAGTRDQTLTGSTWTWGYEASWASYGNQSLNDCSIWNRVLSAPEVALDYSLSQRGYPGVINRQSSTLYYIPSSAANFSYIGSGNLILSGVAPATVGLAYSTSGSLYISGVAGQAFTAFFASTGNLILSGLAASVITVNYLPVGNVVLGGSASCSSSIGQSLLVGGMWIVAARSRVWSVATRPKTWIVYE